MSFTVKFLLYGQLDPPWPHTGAVAGHPPQAVPARRPHALPASAFLRLPPVPGFRLSPASAFGLRPLLSRLSLSREWPDRRRCTPFGGRGLAFTAPHSQQTGPRDGAAHFLRDWPGPGGAHIRGGPSFKRWPLIAWPAGWRARTSGEPHFPRRRSVPPVSDPLADSLQASPRQPKPRIEVRSSRATFPCAAVWVRCAP